MKKLIFISKIKIILLGIEAICLSPVAIIFFILTWCKLHKFAHYFLSLCLKLFPRYKNESLDMFAYNFYRSGNLKKAAEYYEKSINESSIIDINNYKELEIIYEKIGDVNLAIKYYKYYIDKM